MTFTTTPSTFADAVVTLGLQVRGRVIMPGEDGYDAARAAWDASVDQRPTVIVVAADAADVAAAVRFAHATDLPVAVQATGHGGARPADGAVLIVTSGLTAVSVDPVQRTAYVGCRRQVGRRAGRRRTPRPRPAAGIDDRRRRRGLHAGRWHGLARPSLRAGRRQRPVVRRRHARRHRAARRRRREPRAVLGPAGRRRRPVRRRDRHGDRALPGDHRLRRQPAVPDRDGARGHGPLARLGGHRARPSSPRPSSS